MRLLVVLVLLIGCGYETDWVECKPEVAETNPCIVECRGCGQECIDECSINILGQSKSCVECALTLAIPECKTFMGWDGCREECRVIK